MTESLPELIARRMADLKAKSVRDLDRRLPDGDRITYETFHKLANGEQRRTRDARVFRDVALICGVSEGEVRVALGVGPTYGPFELPPRAQGLNPDERSVVDAILNARRQGGSVAGTTGQAADPGDQGGTVAELPPLDLLAADRQDGPSAYEQQSDAQDAAEAGSKDHGSNGTA